MSGGTPGNILSLVDRANRNAKKPEKEPEPIPFASVEEATGVISFALPDPDDTKLKYYLYTAKLVSGNEADVISTKPPTEVTKQWREARAVNGDVEFAGGYAILAGRIEAIVARDLTPDEEED
jgi:hypothetical protein